MIREAGEGKGETRMQSYRELFVWQKAMALVVAIYRITCGFPKSEVYGLASQKQRDGVSIPSTIAEGHRLKQTPAYLRHLATACGSLSELETQIELSDRLGYLPPNEKNIIVQANEVSRRLSGLRQSLRAKIGAAP
jgi:four helix bundle protein